LLHEKNKENNGPDVDMEKLHHGSDFYSNKKRKKIYVNIVVCVS